MRKSRHTVHTRLLALLLLTGLLLPAPLLAHGGVGLQHLNNVPAGPFRVYVWSDPEPPQVGEYHVTIAITENIAGDATGLAGGPVLDAYIIVELLHQESGATLSAQATHDDALNKLFYEASFEPAQKGSWAIQVRIASPGCGPAGSVAAQQPASSAPLCKPPQVVSFQDEILPKAFPWQAVLGGLLSLLLLAGAVLLYWMTKPPAPAESPAPGNGQRPAPAGGSS